MPVSLKYEGRNTAVAALWTLGTLTVLADGLSAKVTTVAQPKALFCACLASAYVAAQSISGSAVSTCGVLSADLGSDVASKDVWQRQLGGQRLGMWLGRRGLNALRLARYAGFWAEPVGFAIEYQFQSTSSSNYYAQRFYS
jgi:hypothetical protein